MWRGAALFLFVALPALRGRGPVYREGDDSQESGPRSGPPGSDSDYVLLPLYGVQDSAGDGGSISSEEVEDLLAFKREWITRELRASPEALSLIYVQGESMVPTLNPGDVILVQRNHSSTVSDGIYVIRMGEALLVKLHDLLLPYREGSCDVSVQYVGDVASARLSLGPDWSVRPSRELRDKLSELLGSQNVRMLYASSRDIM